MVPSGQEVRIRTAEAEKACATLGAQNWIRRHADAARRMAEEGSRFAQDLMEIAEINERLVTAPPRRFRDAGRTGARPI